MTEEAEVKDLPTWLIAPPMEFPAGPVTTRAQDLPFGDLRWENFERLCARLERANADIQFCRVYGVSGQAQEGIDLYSRRTSETKYRVLQCKRVEDFTPVKIRNAVGAFVEGSWATRSGTFVLCTKESLRRTERAEEIEKQRAQLKGIGVEFETWDADQLADDLKEQPAIVSDFFGQEWATKFCGAAAVEALGRRLDGIRGAELRKKLSVFYQHVFHAHDPGLPVESEISRVLPLLERYIIPDVYQDQSPGLTIAQPQPSPRESLAGEAQASSPDFGGRQPEAGTMTAARTYRQRRPLDDWLADAPRNVVSGGPGLGKSSLLRFLALRSARCISETDRCHQGARDLPASVGFVSPSGEAVSSWLWQVFLTGGRARMAGAVDRRAYGHCFRRCS